MVSASSTVPESVITSLDLPNVNSSALCPAGIEAGEETAIVTSSFALALSVSLIIFCEAD